jgi:hypothetical protein
VKEKTMAPEARLKREEESVQLKPTDYSRPERTRPSAPPQLVDPEAKHTQPADGGVDVVPFSHEPVTAAAPAASAHDEPSRNLLAASKVEPSTTAFRLDSFSWWLVGTAAAYGFLFLAKFFWARYEWGTDVVNVTWNVRGTPRIAIVVAVALAASILWFMRNTLGKALALVPLLFALYQFYAWYSETAGLKTSFAPGEVQELTGVRSLLHGASLLDLLALAVIFTLTVVGGLTVLKELRKREARQFSQPGPAVQHPARRGRESGGAVPAKGA